MLITGAKVQEQGVTFGMIVVKNSAMNSPSLKKDIQMLGKQLFGAIPIILMSQNARGIPRYFGRKDIVQFLSRIHPSQIPWRKYSIA